MTIDLLPIIVVALFFGWMIGYGHGRKANGDRLIKLASEEDLISEVKERRIKKLIEEEVKSNLEKELAR